MQQFHSDAHWQSAEVFTELAEDYDKSYDNRVYGLEDEWLSRRLLRGGWNTGRILDAGSGTGMLITWIGVPSERYVGLDVAPGMVKRASLKFPTYRFFVEDMSKLENCSLGTFDHIFCLHGPMSYAEDAEAVLKSFAFVSRPGTRVVVVAYNPCYADRPLYVCNRIEKPIPFRTYSTQEWLDMSKRNGFFCDQVQGFTWMADYIPKWIPMWMARAYYRLEMVTVARLFPDRCYAQLVEMTYHG